MRSAFLRPGFKKARVFIGAAMLTLPLLTSAETTPMTFNTSSQSAQQEQRNQSGQTPLMAAVYQGEQQLALQLIQAGADVNAQDNIANSPFLYAGAEGMLELVQASLEHGADFTVVNRYGGTALIPAAEKGHLEVVKLLAFTPDYPINHINHLGWTALMEAVVLGDGGPTQVEIVKVLLEAGADASIPDKEGVSALSHAKQRGFTDISALLE